MRPVDGAALAVAMGVSERRVRYLVACGVIVPIGRWRLAPTGRPRHWFDLDTAMVAFGGLTKSPGSSKV